MMNEEQHHHQQQQQQQQQQQFCLQWNNHKSTLINVFERLLENETFVDCTLAAEGKFLRAHKMVLSACSPYFASLLSQVYDKHPVLILKDVKFLELKAIMDYMYRGEIKIAQDQLAALLKVAVSLQIKGLSVCSPQKTSIQVNEQKPITVPTAINTAKIPMSPPSNLESKRLKLITSLGNISLETQELSGSRENSSSPTLRKRKKSRRKSMENKELQHHQQQQQTQQIQQQQQQQQQHQQINSTSLSMQQINSSVPKIISTFSTTPTIITSQHQSLSSSATTDSVVTNVTGGIIVESMGSGLSVIKTADSVNVTERGMNTDDNRNEKQPVVPIQLIACKKEQSDKQFRVSIEPKTEHENDEPIFQYLTLEQPGPSHGGGGGTVATVREITEQKYTQWQVDRSQNEGLMATQQEVTEGQQDPNDAGVQTMITPEEFELNDGLLESNDIVITKNKDGYVLHVEKFGNIITPKIGSVESATVAMATATTATIIDDPQDSKPTLTSLGTCQVEGIDLKNNPQTSTHMISDLAKYAEIDDIELPDGTKIGISLAPAEITEEQMQNAGNTGDEQVEIAATGESTLPSSQSSDHNGEDGRTVATSFTILTTSPIEGHQDQEQQTWELALSDNSMSQSEENDFKAKGKFVCRYCGKQYRWLSTLRRHEKVECGGKEPCHPCPYCTYKSRQRGNLGVHIRKHHPEKPGLESKRGRGHST